VCARACVSVVDSQQQERTGTRQRTRGRGSPSRVVAVRCCRSSCGAGGASGGRALALLTRDTKRVHTGAVACRHTPAKEWDEPGTTSQLHASRGARGSISPTRDTKRVHTRVVACRHTPAKEWDEPGTTSQLHASRGARGSFSPSRVAADRCCRSSCGSHERGGQGAVNATRGTRRVAPRATSTSA
jgi:hypothetical protein